MKFRTNLKHSNSLIDLTPLVDVVFLMLIFFIVTSDILPLKSLNIQNPTLKTDSAPLTSRLFIVVDAQNVIYLGSKKAIVDMNELKQRLQEEIHQIKILNAGIAPTVVLSIDKRVDYGTFLQVFSIAQQFGERIRLVYQTPEEERVM